MSETRYRCPGCHCDDQMTVLTKSYCHLGNDGTLEGPEHSMPQDVIADDHVAVCVGCGHKGTLVSFEVQGWDIFHSDSRCFEIQRIDEEGIFEDDEEARNYVYSHPQAAKACISQLLEMLNDGNARIDEFRCQKR